MIFNLDTYEIDSIVLGQKTELEEGTHDKGVYSFFVKNGHIKNMGVRLGEFYSKGPVFDGQIQINKKLFEADQNFLPKLVLSEFENEISNWNDGVEINHHFIVGNVELEFSWCSVTLSSNYISIEVE